MAVYNEQVDGAEACGIGMYVCSDPGLSFLTWKQIRVEEAPVSAAEKNVKIYGDDVFLDEFFLRYNSEIDGVYFNGDTILIEVKEAYGPVEYLLTPPKTHFVIPQDMDMEEYELERSRFHQKAAHEFTE